MVIQNRLRFSGLNRLNSIGSMQEKSLYILSLTVVFLVLSACSGSAAVNPLPPPLTTTFRRQESVPPQPTQSSSLTPSPTITPSATPTVTPLPEEFYIRDISGHRQFFTLGCEAATAKDWANYFGYDFNEFEFQVRLPLSDNPEFGFVGDVNAPWGQVPPYGYGVHAGPVADLLNEYGIPARAYKEYTLDQIVEKIAQGKPVIAWVIGNVVGGVPYEYTDSKGNKTIVAAFQHVVIVTGYNAEKVRYMTNGRFYETPREVFLNSWGVLGNMVIVDE
jgi:uncharacterized protein YvpB